MRIQWVLASFSFFIYLTLGEHYASPFRHQAFAESGVNVDDIEVRVITAEEVVKYVQFSGFEQGERQQVVAKESHALRLLFSDC